MNFFAPSKDFSIQHTGKGKFTCSNGVSIEFNDIGSFKYCRVIHKSGLPILHFDNPVKNQKVVLSPVVDFLSKYDFSLDVDTVRMQIENDPLIHKLMEDRDKTYNTVYGN
jgi:hypothetical protein